MALDGTLGVSTAEDTVAFTFRVTNAGDEPVELEFRNGLAADFIVFDGATTVWQWSEGRMFTQALWSESLDADESVSYEATWSDPVAGTYDVIASLEASNADLEARTSFDV